MIFKPSPALMDSEAASTLFIQLPFGKIEHGLFLIIASVGCQLIALFLPSTMVYSLVESRLKIIKHLPTKPAEPDSLTFSYYIHEE